MVTHLKFFIQRIRKNEVQELPLDKDLYNMIVHSYHKEYIIAQRIAGIILSDYDYKTSEDEIMFLTIHIHRVNFTESDVNEQI